MIQFPFEMVPFFCGGHSSIFRGVLFFSLKGELLSTAQQLLSPRGRFFLSFQDRPGIDGTLRLSLSSLSPFFCDHVFRVSFLTAHLYGHYALVFLVSAQNKQK